MHSLNKRFYTFNSNLHFSGNLTNIPCLVMFKRKLWFNVIPGKDLIADLTFHFPQVKKTLYFDGFYLRQRCRTIVTHLVWSMQEMPRYLRGDHDCSREDMINLGGLLFRVAVDSDRSQFVMIPRMLDMLVPADQIQLMSVEEWKKVK